MTDVELKLTADVGQATKGISGFRKEFADMVKAVEKPLGQIDALQKVQESAKQASTAFFDARQKVTNLQQALAKVSGPAAKLGQSLAQAEKEMTRANAAVDRQKQKLEAQRGAVLATKQALDDLKRSQVGVDGATGKGDAQAITAAKQAVAAATAEYEKQRAALAAHQQALAASRASVKVLGDEYQAAVQPVRILETELGKAERNLARTTQEFDRQKAKVREQRAELKAAGVDTRNLASEQQRLQAELAKAVLAGRRDQAVQGIRAQSAALGQLAREQRLANLEQAKADFGISRARQFEGALAQLRNQYQLLRTSGNLTTRELSIAQRAYTQRVRETTNATNGLVAEQRRLRGGGALLPGLVSGVGAAYATVAAIKGIAAQADAYNLMNARLKLATSSQEEFTTAQTELGRIAQATQSPVASLVTLYGRISRPLKEAGRSQADILKVTEAVATSFRVSGATAEEAQNGVIQFAQALGSGALRGDEFNSVAEQAPRLMQALADSIGVPTGALKEMAAEGLLTADVVSDALTRQLDVLRKEAESLPETVGGAMTALTDQWNKAIGQADVKPLIDAINELSKTVSDPQIIESLVAIASGMATLAGWTVQVASEFAKFADKVAFTSAQLATGSGETAEQVKELEKLKRALVEVNAARTGSSFIGSATLPLLLKYFAPERLEEWATELEVKIKAFEERLYGISQGEGVQELEFLAEVGAAAAEAARQKEIDARTKHIGELKKLQDQQVKDAEKGVKALVAAEKKATAELQKVRDERLKIEERYRDALANLGGEGDASYGAAQALKVGARQALAAGDIQGAQSQAQAALKMLQDLAAAGENTYGFAGFIQELQAIELAANDLEQTNAEQKIEAIKAEMLDLKVKAAALEDMPVTVKMDDAALAAVKAALADLSNTKVMVQVGAKYDFETPYTLVDPGPAPGYATGGWTGPGSKYKPAGFVHADEHVQPKEVVNEPGALPFLEQIRRYGFRNTINQLQARIASGMRGYADGGPVSPSRMVPNIPQINPSLMQRDNPLADWGRATLDSGGDSIEVLMKRDSFDKLLRRTATKIGRTTRN